MEREAWVWAGAGLCGVLRTGRRVDFLSSGQALRSPSSSCPVYTHGRRGWRKEKESVGGRIGRVRACVELDRIEARCQQLA
jgi:hypothetical protein